ncbi:NAD(P)H-dependent oxidoreductase [Streptomyces sp. Go40/10]|uniref:NAD(P)H-dependent oxidoreductase n=1 Tax=Streptomyces sp. Go40/10 TaxID=2825844 RepID=UPI001E294796|nr:NAD(P)H-dependent oxidoreductase [Streptomyces sp. Go40/10]UFR00017.1 NAD(P)H-dependent oxidoreductase [Streptomyces sp. Go40/10]
MATVLSVSGSPSVSSGTQRLLRHLDDRLLAQGHDVIALDVRTVPAEALPGADSRHPAVVEAAELFARADGVVVATPPRLPVPQAADPGRGGQHGLEIVMALCRSFETHREPVGERIVATVALADDPVGDEADNQVC